MIKNKYFVISFSLIFLSVIYFTSRIFHLTSLPVFGDEAIYVRWAQIIKNVETLRFIPLTDGKQPLFMWLNSAFLKFFSDPLFAGRFVSVFSGWLITILLFLTTCIITYTKREDQPQHYIVNAVKQNYLIGFISIFIYICLPFTFFFDRMALADTMLSFFGITSLFFAFMLTRYPRLDLSFLLGFSLGFSWLTKSPAIYYFILSYVTFIFFNLPVSKKNIKLYIYPLISLILGYFIYNILRLGPQFHMIAIRNFDYVWPVTEIIKHPLDPLYPHLTNVFQIFTQYIGFIITTVSFILLLFILKKHKAIIPSIFILICWWMAPLIANAAFSKVFTARYILFTLPPLIIIFAVTIYYSVLDLKRIFSIGILAIIFFNIALNLAFIYKLSTAPFFVHLPQTESGYISDWTSGWGIQKSAEYLKNRARSANVIVGTEGYFGTLPDGLEIYSDGIKHLTIFGVGLGFNQIPEKLIDAKNHGDEVYLLINKSRLNLYPEEKRKLNLVSSFDKPGNDQLLLFRL